MHLTVAIAGHRVRAVRVSRKRSAAVLRSHRRIGRRVNMKEGNARPMGIFNSAVVVRAILTRPQWSGACVQIVRQCGPACSRTSHS
jgi:hypothetical protein